MTPGTTKQIDDYPHRHLKVLLETLERETVTIEGHQDPKAIHDCWRLAHDLIEEMINECSHLAANTCPYSYGDEYGNQRCAEIDHLKQMLTSRENFKGK